MLVLSFFIISACGPEVLVIGGIVGSGAGPITLSTGNSSQIIAYPLIRYGVPVKNHCRYAREGSGTQKGNRYRNH